MKKGIFALLAASTFNTAHASENALSSVADNVLTAYEVLVDHEFEKVSFSDRESACERDVCAINFKAGQERFGFIAQILSPLSDSSDSPVMTFAVDADGVTLGSLIPSITLPKNARILRSEQTAEIGRRAHKALGILGWIEFETLIPEMSECRTIRNTVSCRLNFRTDRENFGVLLNGFINPKNDDLVFVSTFGINPNGV